MIKGYKKPLVEDDMFNLNQRDLCKHAYRRFLKNWNKEVLLKRFDDSLFSCFYDQFYWL